MLGAISETQVCLELTEGRAGVEEREQGLKKKLINRQSSRLRSTMSVICGVRLITQMLAVGREGHLRKHAFWHLQGTLVWCCVK